MQFTTKQYNLLERAVTDGLRIAVYRRGSEYVVRPESLGLRAGREAIETVQPATGDRMTIYLDDIDGFEVVDA
ncbi:MAG TPA: hypothetical protein VGT98_08105 [Candidatus Elarobacter sp.]|nr:hypothetical protein [Candidatus Elarobacter sp.]